MTFLERTTDVGKLRHWDVDMSVDYIYTSGIAGEKFFATLRDEGRILAVRCPVCKISQLPPRMFCESCFSKLADYVEVPLEGKIAAVTLMHVDRLGGALDPPEAFAFVTFRGVEKGGLIHRLLVPPAKAKAGTPVRIKLRPRAARTGTILDIEGFEPVSSQL